VPLVATYVLIHGAGDVGWYWHLVEAELQTRGHQTVAPDLPADDDALTLTDYRDAVVDAVRPVRSQPLIVVGQSFGAFTAPLVAEQLSAAVLVFVAGMVPAVGEAPDDWWDHVGFTAAVGEQAARDRGQTGSDDPFVAFYHDVPRDLAEEALRRERAHPSPAAGASVWPLHEWPEVVVKSVVCAQDHFLPPDLQRRLAHDRLGVVPEEIDSGHCVALSRPTELATLLHVYATQSIQMGHAAS
jgi:pimeloyl-ACP methyl ester carboxylesterase